MFISDVLRVKGHHVVRVHTTDSVALARPQARGAPASAL